MSKKALAAGLGLLIFGGASVYLLTNNSKESYQKASTIYQPGAVQAAINQVEQTESHQTIEASGSLQISSSDATPEMTHAAFLAQADARREQNMENKAEIERLEKLKKAKKNSAECKFWRQQQKNSSTAARIEEKISTYCELPKSSAAQASEPAIEEPISNTE